MKIRKFTIFVLLSLSVLSAIFYSSCSKNREKVNQIIPDLTEKIQKDDNFKLNENKPDFKFITPKPKLSPRLPKKKRKNLVISSCNFLKI